jgi:hypothetical protein
MKRLLSSAAIFGFAVAALALGAYTKVVQDTYKLPAGSPAAAAKCSLCHAGKMGGKLNAYGIDLKGAMKGSKAITPAMLHAIDRLDSNKDGVKNAEALKAGKLP